MISILTQKIIKINSFCTTQLSNLFSEEFWISITITHYNPTISFPPLVQPAQANHFFVSVFNLLITESFNVPMRPFFVSWSLDGLGDGLRDSELLLELLELRLHLFRFSSMRHLCSCNGPWSNFSIVFNSNASSFKSLYLTISNPALRAFLWKIVKYLLSRALGNINSWKVQNYYTYNL